MSDDTKWVRMLYSLRNTLWPNGELIDDKRNCLNDQQKVQIRKKAMAEIKDFLPSKVVNTTHIVWSLLYCY